MSNKGKNYSDYQKEYRKKNKNKAKQYQEKYRYNQKLLKSIDSPISLSNKSYKSRIYIAKVGDERIKIGASFPFSNRMYNLKKILANINISFTPLFYFDCENEEIIKKIEKSIKVNFCDKKLGINIPSFKNEVACITKINDIKNHIDNILNKSGFTYYITVVKDL